MFIGLKIRTLYFFKRRGNPPLNIGGIYELFQ